MVHELSVTEETNRGSATTPSLERSISAESGIESVDDGSLTPGTHVVSVHFEDQAVYEHFVGHDVHLARLEADPDRETVAAWMEWRRPEEVETPAPVSFVGGTNEVPAGDTAYFTVDIAPGRYAWIAEILTPADEGMLVPLSVPSDEDITNHDRN